jgi:NAD(P)-dependent dehydrogenase (short-subunit alcohol dehydrogenase family)
MKNPFDLKGRVVVITGSAGFLGKQHAEAIAAFGGAPVLIDLAQAPVKELTQALNREYGTGAAGFRADIRNEKEVAEVCKEVISSFGKVDVLVNNAANNPQVRASGRVLNSSRLESFPINLWNEDIAVGLTGSFLCTKYFGQQMALSGGGSIINISSDLGIIAPDQRLYRKDGVPEDLQDVKPVTYSVIKTGLIGLTRYTATYWAHKKVRCNALCPGGMYNGQSADFVERVSALIPAGRMAELNEYQGAIVFLASDASSYMNGAVLVMDGGRSCW